MKVTLTIEIGDHIADEKLPGELSAAFRGALRIVSGQLVDRRHGTHADELADYVASSAIQAGIGAMFEEAMKTGGARDHVARHILDHCAFIMATVRTQGDYTAPRDVVIAP